MPLPRSTSARCSTSSATDTSWSSGPRASGSLMIQSERLAVHKSMRAIPSERALEGQPVARFFRIDPSAAAAAAGIECEMLGDPRTGPKSRVAGHELRQVMAGLGAVGKARQRDVRAELAALDLDAAVARHGRNFLLQPLQPVAPFDRGDQGARLLAAAELLDAGQRHGKARPRDVGEFLLEVAHHGAVDFAREAERDVEIL